MPPPRGTGSGGWSAASGPPRPISIGNGLDNDHQPSPQEPRPHRGHQPDRSLGRDRHGPAARDVGILAPIIPVDNISAHQHDYSSVKQAVIGARLALALFTSKYSAKEVATPLPYPLPPDSRPRTPGAAPSAPCSRSRRGPSPRNPPRRSRPRSPRRAAR